MRTLWAFPEPKQVDFIERYFGSSPDHGARSFELLLLIASVAMITVLGLQFFHRLRD
jgi:hypothetical protein